MTGQLKRVTTEYINIEDRIRLNGQLPDGTVTIWLTQRLCNGLVSNLINWLKKTLPESHILAGEERHSFAQQSANLAYQHGATESNVVPEQSPDRHKSWLAFSISMRSTSQAISITIADPEEKESVEFAMGAEQLRQWLTILHKSYNQANWADDVWPEWIKEHSVNKKPGHHPVH